MSGSCFIIVLSNIIKFIGFIGVIRVIRVISGLFGCGLATIIMASRVMIVIIVIMGLGCKGYLF